MATRPTTQTASPLQRANELCAQLYAGSEQSMYLYLDDREKSCNDRFAKLLGYPSPAAWAAVTGPFPMAFVAEESRDDLVGAYQDAMEYGVASAIPVTWTRKDGKPVETNVILAPLDVDGARLAVHFIDPAQ